MQIVSGNVHDVGFQNQHVEANVRGALCSQPVALPSSEQIFVGTGEADVAAETPASAASGLQRQQLPEMRNIKTKASGGSGKTAVPRRRGPSCPEVRKLADLCNARSGAGADFAQNEGELGTPQFGQVRPTQSCSVHLRTSASLFSANNAHVLRLYLSQTRRQEAFFAV